ncbi:MAG: hypothetical protein ACREED_07640, partial [Stellaceae bacterium]
QQVLFPMKAAIDLAYFAHRTLLGDLSWVVRGALAVFGWSSLAAESAGLIDASTASSDAGDLAGHGPTPIRTRTRVNAHARVLSPVLIGSGQSVHPRS